MLEPVWRSLEQQVEAGWAPGITAGIRYRGKTEYFATGRLSFEGETEGTGAGDEPMRTDTRFRIASLSKPIGGALALSMVADGLFALDDPVAPWLPELADPRVLVAPDAPLDQTVPADKPITVQRSGDADRLSRRVHGPPRRCPARLPARRGGCTTPASTSSRC